MHEHDNNEKTHFRPLSPDLEDEQMILDENEEPMPRVNQIGYAKTDTTFDKLPRKAQMLLGMMPVLVVEVQPYTTTFS